MTIRKTNERMQELAQKWRDGRITAAEKAEFDAWYTAFDDSELREVSGETPAALKERLYRAILENAPVVAAEENVRAIGRNRRWLWYAAATSLVAFLSVGGYFLMNRKPGAQIAQNQTGDVAPGGNKAILYSRGKRILLEKAGNGLVARHGRVLVTKTGAGELAYRGVASAETGGELVYDTLYAPRGGQQSVTFADGTRVSLNADTKIRFPESFTGSERRVELLSGEADFEVAHHAARPFRLLVKGQLVEDIGTEFNVSAYADEPGVRTTLVEGSVMVSKGNERALLKPGQQSLVTSDSKAIGVREVDVDAVMDWKHNEFYFKREALASIMRRVARWYDVKVVYREEQMKPVSYSGSVARFSNLSKVLAKLEASGDARFRIEGKQVIVYP